MKYTSLEKIFTFLPKSLGMSDDDVIEFAAQAMDALNIHQVYEKKVCLVKVVDHQASLPKDFKYIELVTYMYNQPTEAERDQIITSFSKTKEQVGDTLVTTVSSMTTEPLPSMYNLDHILRIQHQGVLNNYQLWVDSDYFVNNFKPLRLVNKSKATTFHCVNSPNLYCESVDYYQINMNGQIITSVKEGYLSVFYLAKSRNDRNYFKIPDDFDVLTAIAAYIKYKHMEEQAFRTQKGYRASYQDELVRWEMLSAKVKGKYILSEVTTDLIENFANGLSRVFHQSNIFDNHATN